jgi:hypothetical protein
MDEEHIESKTNGQDPAKAAAIAQQIVGILINENPEVRQRALRAALIALGDKYPVSETVPRTAEAIAVDGAPTTELGDFFGRQEDLKPSDYAQLCAAYHFALHGPLSFSLEELRTIAGEAGVILPDRLDMTLNKATSKGKKLFQSTGRGTFKPTAAAGLVFKERWGVRPGRVSKAPADQRRNE